MKPSPPDPRLNDVPKKGINHDEMEALRRYFAAYRSANGPEPDWDKRRYCGPFSITRIRQL